MFDICAIVASDPKRAESFRKLIDIRIEHGVYPSDIEFRILSDPPGGRVGSGGGTLNALLSLPEAGIANILIIQAGGENRRLPLYSPEGKIFAPVPLPSSSLLPPVMLDVILSLYLKYPWNKDEIVIASGDVVIDFDTETLTSDRGEICGFTTKADFETGSQHGVYVFNRDRNSVIGFYQKADVETLKLKARLEESDSCALDMGIVSLSGEGIRRFISLRNVLDRNKNNLGSRIEEGNAAFDIYSEVLMACITGQSREQYHVRVTGRTKLSRKELDQFYEILSGSNLRGIITNNTRFIHYGTMTEYPEACRTILRSDLKPFYQILQPEIHPIHVSDCLVFNSELVSEDNNILENLPSGATIENCANLNFEKVANSESGIVSGIDAMTIHTGLPKGFCIERRRLNGCSVFLLYTENDTFKPGGASDEPIFLSIPLSQWLYERGLSSDDIPIETLPDLHSIRLYPRIPDGTDKSFIEKFIRGFIDPVFADESWRRFYLDTPRMSIEEANTLTDPIQRDTEREERRRGISRKSILNGNGWFSVSSRDFQSMFAEADDEERTRLLDILRDTTDSLTKIYRTQLFRDAFPGAESESASGPSIRYIETEKAERIHVRNVKSDQIVWARSPVRLDLAGGWTDTPPYTLKYGGSVLNVAADLNGQPPIQAFCRPSPEPRIRFSSIDLGVYEEITDARELWRFDSPESPFSLPKAACCLLGIPDRAKREGGLIPYLDRFKIGFDLTLLCAVPKGSGLGTSSILAAVILSALQRFFGITKTRDELFREVLQMEQMLTTGGGWQDQIGGVVGGVKLIKTMPSLRPVPMIYQLDPFLFIDPDHRRLFTLFYTGITRLAKNILQEVVYEYNRATPSFVWILSALKDLAEHSRDILEMRDAEGLAAVLRRSWRANKALHHSTTNDEIEALIDDTRDHFSGMKLLGAGGGGYALFLSKSVQDADILREILIKRYENGNARIVDFDVSNTGLQVSVS